MNAAMKLSMVGGLVGRWWRPAEKQAPFLLVRREDRGGTTILHLAGRLAVEEIGVFSDHLHDVLRDGATRLVVNLTACPFADSAGVAVLVRTREQAREHSVRFLLVGVGPQVHSVLEMARLVSLFDIRASLDDAMAG